MTVAHLQGFATGFAESILAGYTHATIQRSIALYCAIPSQVEKITVAHFKYALIHDILVRPKYTSVFENSLYISLQAHSIPNCNALIRLGTVSTICSFTAAATVAILAVVTGP